MESLAAGLRNLKKPWLTGRVESAKSPVGTFSLDHLPAALKQGVITRGTAGLRNPGSRVESKVQSLPWVPANRTPWTTCRPP